MCFFDISLVVGLAHTMCPQSLLLCRSHLIEQNTIATNANDMLPKQAARYHFYYQREEIARKTTVAYRSETLCIRHAVVESPHLTGVPIQKGHRFDAGNNQCVCLGGRVKIRDDAVGKYLLSSLEIGVDTWQTISHIQIEVIQCDVLLAGLTAIQELPA